MKNKHIDIPLSEEDLQDLLNGESFDWTFDDIDVHLEQESSDWEDEEEEE